MPACVSREFTVLATGTTSPVTEWLRALGRHEHERCGGPGIGAVGMCFTGGFALAMMVDPVLLAPVLSQPSLPFGITPSGAGRWASATTTWPWSRSGRPTGSCVLGLRFTGDMAVPPDRFARLRDEFGDAFVGVEIDSSKGNAHGIPRTAHSVLTEHLVDEPGHPTRDALDQVLALLRDRLLTPA